MFYGLDWIATVPPTVRLTRRIFGERTGLMFGWIVAAHQLGAASAAYAAGLIRSTNGDYNLAFFLAGSVCVATAVGVLFIGRGKTQPALPFPSEALLAEPSPSQGG